MSSKRKIAANRRNAQHSTGPKTPQGKTASARNAATHGLSSSFAVLPHEDQSAFDYLLDTLVREHMPRTEHQKFLVQQMAECRWRLERTRRFEAIAYDQLLDRPDRSIPDHVIVERLANRCTNVFDLLQRYANNAERSYYKAHCELTQAQKTAMRNEPTADQAWLNQLFDQTRVPHDPYRYGPESSKSPAFPNEPTHVPESDVAQDAA